MPATASPSIVEMPQLRCARVITGRHGEIPVIDLSMTADGRFVVTVQFKPNGVAIRGTRNQE